MTEDQMLWVTTSDILAIIIIIFIINKDNPKSPSLSLSLPEKSIIIITIIISNGPNPGCDQSEQKTHRISNFTLRAEWAKKMRIKCLK